VALLGRNGVGKSTLLKSIMGMVPPRSGSVLFMGEEMRVVLRFSSPGRGSDMCRKREESSQD